MPYVTSRDGTRIAYDCEGSGAPLLLVDGALCYRQSGPAKPLAKLLAPHFTVYTYDRRGRGESSDGGAYAVEREIEDIAALLDAAGGWAYVYGISSGAALSLEAAARLPGIRKLFVYEAPFIVDDSHSPLPEDFLPRLKAHVAAGERNAAVTMFMRRVGMPAVAVWIMRLMPVWKKLAGIAHTLPYDITIIHDYSHGRPLPAGQWSTAMLPVIVADGGKSPLWMRNAMRAVASVLPNAQYRSLPGQNHMLQPQAVAPMLIEFFQG